MDPTVVNRRTAAPSIVKEAPLALRDETTPSHRPKWLTNHARRPDVRHNRYQHVTQRYLYNIHGRFQWSLQDYLCDDIPFEAPLRGAGASQGGLNDKQ